VSVVVFDVADLRFGISPIWETVTSVWALHNPRRHARHLPWIAATRSLAEDPVIAEHLAWLQSFARPKAWLPDFMTPAPSKPLPTIEEDLDELLSTPAARVVTDIRVIEHSATPLPPRVQAVLDDPDRGMRRIADAIHGWWQAAMMRPWPRIRALHEADIAHRTLHVAEGGARLMFRRLHHSTEWAGDRLLIDDGLDIHVDIGPRGLSLVPSIFADRRFMYSLRGDGVTPGGIYPARAVGTLWEGTDASREIDDCRLRKLVGEARARLMSHAEAPITSGTLAYRAGLTASAASQHLAVLHESGMVTRRRLGKNVYYSLTEAGFTLLDATGAR
jgi:DNA-binding transcriptional ArsR family regulator